MNDYIYCKVLWIINSKYFLPIIIIIALVAPLIFAKSCHETFNYWALHPEELHNKINPFMTWINKVING